MVVNESNFQQEVIESNVPVLVDFWAEWCGPCRMLAPTIEELAKEYEGRAKVCKMNVDEAPNTSSNYKVMSIPTLVVFKGGEEVERMVGVVPKPDIMAKIDAHI